MIVEERLTTYLHSLESADIPVLDEIEQEALADMVPIIRKETKSFLKVMLEIKRPVKILEIGTAVGFSAILMGKYSPEECHITTIENYEKRIPIARANFARAGMEQKITLLEGDALEIMKGMPDDAGFDFVFMDAAKGQYPAYLEQVMRFLVPGGILITDNVLQDGDIIYLEKKQKKADDVFKGKLIKVMAGESYYTIAQKYGIRLKYLYKMNNLSPDAQIYVGQELFVNR